MAITYEYCANENTVFVRVEGVLSVSDIADYVERVQHDPVVQTGFADVVDFSKVEDFLVSYKEARELRIVFSDVQAQKDYKGAVLVGPTDYLFGMARMCETMLSDSMRVIAVHSMDQARCARDKLLEASENLPAT